MYPLTLMETGRAIILRLSGNDKTRMRLADLGFVPGQEIQLINRIQGNVILKINDSRIALDETSAAHIYVEEENK